MTPVIHHEHVRDCIMQNGKKYCEDTEITNGQMVFMGGFVLLIVMFCLVFGFMLLKDGIKDGDLGGIGLAGAFFILLGLLPVVGFLIDVVGR